MIGYMRCTFKMEREFVPILALSEGRALVRCVVRGPVHKTISDLGQKWQSAL